MLAQLHAVGAQHLVQPRRHLRLQFPPRLLREAFQFTLVDRHAQWAPLLLFIINHMSIATFWINYGEYFGST